MMFSKQLAEDGGQRPGSTAMAVAVMLALFATGGIFTSGTANAQGMANAMEECASIPDAKVRLACFDALSRSTLSTGKVGGGNSRGFGLPTNESQAPTGDTGASTFGTVNSAPVTRSTFGAPAKASPEKLNQITVTITRAKKKADGKWKLTTQDGQVWHQIDGQVLFLRNLPIEATIKTAALGSFRMKLPGLGKTIRVRRKK